MGASAVTAVAAAASVSKTLSPAEPAQQNPPPAPERGGGYNLSEHIKRYYRTARV
jgi:hypothetical protein